jgi:hypothetical protein
LGGFLNEEEEEGRVEKERDEAVVPVASTRDGKTLW